jgi:hypothetical protein
VAEFLSDEWFDALARAATAQPPADNDHDLVIQQTIVMTPDPPITYHLVLSDRFVAVLRGPAPEPTVSLTTDYDTAAAINRGDQSALSAFMGGRLRVGGNIRALVDQAEALSALDDLFASVRAETTFTSHA